MKLCLCIVIVSLERDVATQQKHKKIFGINTGRARVSGYCFVQTDSKKRREEWEYLTQLKGEFEEFSPVGCTTC